MSHFIKSHLIKSHLTCLSHLIKGYHHIHQSNLFLPYQDVSPHHSVSPYQAVSLQVGTRAHSQTRAGTQQSRTSVWGWSACRHDPSDPEAASETVHCESATGSCSYGSPVHPSIPDAAFVLLQDSTQERVHVEVKVKVKVMFMANTYGDFITLWEASLQMVYVLSHQSVLVS